MKRRILSLLLIACFCISLLAGCGSTASTSETAAPAQSDAQTTSDTASQGGDASQGLEAGKVGETTGSIHRGGTLITSRIGVTPLNPTQTIAPQGDKLILGLFFDSLVVIDENLELQPMLAEEWSYSDDYLTLTMKLKEGVKYFDGTEMTAETVKACWDWYLDPETGVTYAGSIKNVESVSVVDTYTIAFNMSSMDTGFLSQLAYQCGYILSPASIEEFKATGDATVFARTGGTGPFILTDVVDGVSYTATKNPNYHIMGEDGEPLPYLDGVVVKVIGDESVAATNLISGDINFCDSLSLPELISQVSNSGTAVSQYLDSPFVFWISLNTTLPPFDNPAVREALNYAFDRQEIIDMVNNGDGSLLPWCVLPTQYYYSDAPIYEYNPELCKQMLADAGYPDGITLDLYYGTIVTLPQVAEVIQNQVAAAGVTMTLNPMDGASVKALWKLTNDETPAGGRLWFVQIPKITPYAQLEPQFGDTAAQNSSKWINEDFQALLDELQSTFDEGRIAEIVAEMQQIALDEDPVIVLHTAAKAVGYGLNVHDVFVDLDGVPVFRAAWMEG